MTHGNTPNPHPTNRQKIGMAHKRKKPKETKPQQLKKSRKCGGYEPIHNQGEQNLCRIPDNCIDKNRYPLFMARAVLRELVQSLQSTGSP